MKILRLPLAVLLLGLVTATPSSAGPPPGAPDPRAMSGIPRVDPQVAAGTITVRVLDGGFGSPAVGVDVTVALTGADGTTATRTATTDGQGRATVEGLSAFIGGTAVASVTRGAESLRSQSIPLVAEAGSRVMLVASGGAEASGAATGGAAAGGTTDSGPAAAAGTGDVPKHGESGGPEVPMPGTAFVLEGTPAGELVVGTFDLDSRRPIGEIVVTLRLEPPGGEVQTRTAKSDARGKVSFEGLLPPAVPAGTQLEVAAILVAGEPEQRSKRFTMDPAVGMAIVLAKGELDARPAAPQAASAPERAQLPGPRIMPSLPDGTVRVRIVDAGDVPVGGQHFTVVKTDQTGADARFEGVTTADGSGEIAVAIQSDAIYMVEVRYDGAPYSSSFFQVDKRGGIAVDLRVFAVTSDISRVRSAVQFDIDPLENDLARIVQLQDVMVTGDLAFWPPVGFQILPAEGAKSVTVLPMSENWLAHEEKAPFVTLAEPIPPGQVVRLAIAYVIDHDGTAVVEFSSPFAAVETGAFIGPDQSLQATGATKSEEVPEGAEKAVWAMGPRSPGAALEFSIAGLPTRTPIYRNLGLVVGLLLGVIGVLAIAMRPRTDPRVRLRQRRDHLLALLDQIPTSQAERRARVVGALDRVWRELDVLGEPPTAAPGQGAAAR